MMFHIVDDQPIVCEHLKELLSVMGHDALTFPSPIEYLEFLQSDKYVQPNAVIADLSMPWMSGAEMMRRIHAQYPDQRFIVISGKPELGDKYRQYEQYKFLSKPLDVKKLESVVELFAGQVAV